MYICLLLLLGIVADVIVVVALQEGFKPLRFWPVVWVVSGSIASMYVYGLLIQHMPISVAYTLWSGLGVLATAIVGWLVYSQNLSITTVVGMVVVVIGIGIVSLGEKSIPSPDSKNIVSPI